jgi:hypothetical protein
MLNLDGRELFGITLKENHFMEKENYKDYFEELWYDDENLLLKFKEKFSCDFFGDDKPIDYHFYLNFMGNEEVGYVVELNMIPTLSCISTNKLLETAKDYNVPIRELNDYDIFTNHWIPILCYQNIDFEIIEDITWYTNGIIEILETATAVIPNINRLIGFYMDRTINGIGTTNWDLLKDLLFDNDAIETTLKRIKGE